MGRKGVTRAKGNLCLQEELGSVEQNQFKNSQWQLHLKLKLVIRSVGAFVWVQWALIGDHLFKAGFGLTFRLSNRKMLQSLGRPEVHMTLDVVLVRGSGQEHEGCLLLTSEVLFVVSVSEDTQQQAFPVTEIDCAQDSKQSNLLIVQLKQPRVACDVEVHFRK